MPLIRKIPLGQGIIGFWKLSESAEELEQIANLSPGDKILYSSFKHKRRRTEFLAARILLAELAGPNLQIVYSESGKPLLPGTGMQVSISHSEGLAAVILGTGKAGIDVESNGRQVGKVAEKFLSDKELTFVNRSADPEKALLLCWCSKETVFKIVGEPGVDFRENILIEPFFVSGNGVIESTFSKKILKAHYTLHYDFIEENAVVWHL